jgi:Domain of unknown function (DUF4136)
MKAIPGNFSFLSAFVSASMLGLAGCATGPYIQADFDRSVDFTAYRTYAFVSPLGTDRNGYQTIISQHLKTATSRELEARGLRLDESSPQLLVNFNAHLSEKMRVVNTSPPASAHYYDYRYGVYSSWSHYPYDQYVTYYHEGTLNIDVIDAAKKQLIWESTAVDTITQKTLNNIQPAVDEAVAAAFEKYPIPAVKAAK